MSAKIRIVLIEKAPVIAGISVVDKIEWVPVRKCCGENEFLFRMNNMRLTSHHTERPASEYYVRIEELREGFSGLIHESLITFNRNKS